jgi:hypothetical protein
LAAENANPARRPSRVKTATWFRSVSQFANKLMQNSCARTRASIRRARLGMANVIGVLICFSLIVILTIPDHFMMPKDDGDDFQ